MEHGQKKDYQVIIIGGGAAGLSAGLWCVELGLRALLLESGNELGGQLLWTYNAIKNHLGIEAENGRELQRIFLKQIEDRQFEIRTNSSVIDLNVQSKQVKLNNGKHLSAEALIIATGIRRRKLNLAGEAKCAGKGLIKSGQEDSEKVRGKTVCVVGGGDAALENALILAEFAEKVILIHRRQVFRARAEFVQKVQQNKKIEVFTEAVVTKLIGQEKLEALELQRSAEIIIRPTDFLLLRLGVEPNTEILGGQINLDRNGYCQITSNCETNIKNVYAIGDVANPVAPTISGAVGMGATAVKAIIESLPQ